jgi:hypothetical protein
MRIDIIRKELERRFREVEEFKGNSIDDLNKLVSNFLHSAFLEPQIKDFLISLSRWNEDFKLTDKFKNIKKRLVGPIKLIVAEIDRSFWSDNETRRKFIEEFTEGLQNSFNFPNPAKESGKLTIDQYLEGLRNFDKYVDYAIEEEDEIWYIMSIINNVFQTAHELNLKFDSNIFHEYKKLDECRKEIAANLIYKAEYEGSLSLGNILPIYLRSRINYLTSLRPQDFGKGVQKEYKRQKIAPITVVTDIKGDCRNVYYAVDKFLSNSKSTSFLISRLITYCRWIKRDEFKKIKKEIPISKKIIEEFIFNQGYFPIVRFKMGRSEPDILAAYSLGARWDNSILIELKQYIGKSCSDRQLETDIGQAQDYLKEVKAMKDDIANVVYLLIFYDGKIRRKVPESVKEPDNVRVEFIYVGEEDTSKLKAPSKTARKKVAKKATRKKKPNA